MKMKNEEYQFQSFPTFCTANLSNECKKPTTMKLSKTVLTYVCLAFAAVSCSDSDLDPSAKDLSQFAQEFMGMRLGSPNAANKSSEAAINQSFQNMMSSRGVVGGRVAGDSTGNGGGVGDSTIYKDPWVSCAIITTTENPDGSTTTIYDYGDGCEEGWGEYKYFMHGKTIQTYKYTSQQTGSVFRDSYLFKMRYDNYGGNYNSDSSAWNINGNSHYEGYSSYDTANNKFSGAYSYNDTSLYEYGDKGYEYKSKGKSNYDETGWVVEESDYEYGDETGYYRSHVVEPLVYNYLCNVFDEDGLTEAYVWVAVSGKEIVTYSQGGEAGSFEIEYGNGECDNIIYVTENGIRVRVDLGAGWVVETKEG